MKPILIDWKINLNLTYYDLKESWLSISSLYDLIYDEHKKISNNCKDRKSLIAYISKNKDIEVYYLIRKEFRHKSKINYKKKYEEHISYCKSIWKDYVTYLTFYSRIKTKKYSIDNAIKTPSKWRWGNRKSNSLSEYWHNYQWKKISLSIFYYRVKKWIDIELAIKPEYKKTLIKRYNKHKGEKCSYSTYCKRIREWYSHEKAIANWFINK